VGKPLEKLLATEEQQKKLFFVLVTELSFTLVAYK
jgi:hypothetical protein